MIRIRQDGGWAVLFCVENIVLRNDLKIGFVVWRKNLLFGEKEVVVWEKVLTFCFSSTILILVTFTDLIQNKENV